MTAKGAVLWHVVLIGTLGGGLFGCHIGYAGVTMQFNNYLGNCTRYETPQACGGVSAVCEWYVNPLDASQQECAFKDQLIANKAVAPVVIYNGCDLHASGDACTDIPHCEHQDNACYHETEWNSNDRGLFSGMMIVGAMFSSIPAGSLLNRFGRKKVISAAGALAVLTGVLLILGWAHDSDGQLGTFALLSAARFIAGVSVGIISVASPMYVGEMAGDLKWPGMLFQISCTLGIFLMALIGFLIHKEGEDLKTDDGLKGKFQVLNGILTAIAVLYTVLGFVINEPATSDDESKPLQGGAEVAKIPWSEMKVPIISAVALSAAQQLTGINAIMNYAPALSSNFGFKPLEGNMIIMLWNFVTTIASLKLSSMMKPTKMFIIFAYIASVACLVTGIPTFPSVFPDGNTTGQVLSAAGIVIFIAAFEMGMGPCFYVLAQSLFPASRRSEGCSFTLVVQFVFNVIINWGYPVLVTALSGGKNGNQRQGTAIMFLAFGVIGILCTFGLMLNVARQESTDEPDDE